jgi:uncharacterized membrane protein
MSDFLVVFLLPLKFVHMVSMAVMLGTWLGVAMFMLLAHRYGKAPVMALISVIVVRIELWVMLPAVVLQPLVGLPLAFAVRSSATEYWLEVSAVIYAAVAFLWFIDLLIEMRIRRLSRDAALAAGPLPSSYRPLFWVWSLFTIIGLAGMIAIMALMIWQPQWS